ncbi:MAG: hypothetical protein U0Y10_09475 [Spirosomataceae bacterium]
MVKPASSTRRFDFKTMVLCLLAAMMFWLMNALNKDGYTTKLSYPLQVSYNDSLFIPTSPLPKQVQVNISGKGWSLLRKSLSFSVNPVVYQVTQPLRAKFINTSSLTDLMSEQVRDVKVNYVVADTLDLEFDRKVVKKIRLQIDSTSINLRRPFVISSVINVNPQLVVFEGPESLLKSFKDTLLVRVPERRIDTDYDSKIALEYLHDPSISTSVEKVQVSFEVAALQIPLSENPKALPSKKAQKK